MTWNKLFVSPRFSSNSETFASELLENIKEFLVLLLLTFGSWHMVIKSHNNDS